tara:strand:- start:4001 stop:4345 length:345 start_codon:yes stop_codon:yes gene_type:complete
MADILLFVKDFELGSKLSSSCVDVDKQVEFSDENSNPKSFPETVKLAVVDMDEKVFSSVGLVAELKRKGLKVVGTMKKINNRDQSKLRSAGCDIILPRASLVKTLPTLIDELID